MHTMYEINAASEAVRIAEVKAIEDEAEAQKKRRAELEAGYDDFLATLTEHIGKLKALQLGECDYTLARLEHRLSILRPDPAPPGSEATEPDAEPDKDHAAVMVGLAA